MVPDEEALSLSAARERAPPVFANDSASLINVGDGIVCLEIHRKMNTLDGGVFDALEAALTLVARDFRGLIIGNEAPRAFSAGADVSFFADAIRRGDRAGIDAFLARGQALFSAMKYAPFPVVGAGFGLALGGGCEVLLHCNAVVTHSEINIGLPEARIGLIPAWGGTTQMLVRTGSPEAAFALLRPGAIAKSAREAVSLGYLRANDPVVANRSRLLAKSRAVATAGGYLPPSAPPIPPGGASSRGTLLDALPPEERTPVAEALAWVLTGGDHVQPTEADLMVLEREAFVELAFRPETLPALEKILGR